MCPVLNPDNYQKLISAFERKDHDLDPALDQHRMQDSRATLGIIVSMLDKTRASLSIILSKLNANIFLDGATVKGSANRLGMNELTVTTICGGVSQ